VDPSSGSSGQMNPQLVEPLAMAALVVVVLVIRVGTGHPPRWIERMQQRSKASGRPRDRRPFPSVPIARPLIEIGLIGVLPWLAYLVLRRTLGSATLALAIVTAIPVAWAIIRWVRARRVDAGGLVVIAAYACALAISLILGDSPIPLKLRDAGILGAVGLACFISVIVGRPLLWLALRYLGREAPAGELAERIDDPKRRRDLSAATVLAGVVFLLATCVEVVVMAGASTSTFLAIAGPLGGLTPVAAMALMLVFLRSRARAR